MTRTGHCLQCGARCRALGFWVDLGVPGTAEWLEARGLALQDNMVVFEYPCPHLTAENKCDLEGSGKPLICRRFSTELAQLLESCGFTFEE